MRKRSSLVCIEAEEFYKIDGISKINAHLKQKVICQVPLNELTSLPEPMLQNFFTIITKKGTLTEGKGSVREY
jgi:hypothetical protein